MKDGGAIKVNQEQKSKHRHEVFDSKAGGLDLHRVGHLVQCGAGHLGGAAAAGFHYIVDE